MKQRLRALAANPLAYIVGFGVGGAMSIVAGVAVLANPGWSLVVGGAFLLAAARYISKGLTPNG